MDSSLKVITLPTKKREMQIAYTIKVDDRLFIFYKIRYNNGRWITIGYGPLRK